MDIKAIVRFIVILEKEHREYRFEKHVKFACKPLIGEEVRIDNVDCFVKRVVNLPVLPHDGRLCVDYRDHSNILIEIGRYEKDRYTELKMTQHMFEEKELPKLIENGWELK
jgi:hypothetical protein